jgi:hypothetical protein
LVRSGAVRDYAELARLGQVSRARTTQIMSLLHLAPDLQEQILFLPRIQKGGIRFTCTTFSDWRGSWTGIRSAADGTKSTALQQSGAAKPYVILSRSELSNPRLKSPSKQARRQRGLSPLQPLPRLE